MAFHALARLRDPGSVPHIVRYLESQVGAKEYNGAVGLASIGTEEAESALLNLMNQTNALLVRGLVNFGSRKCIERAIEIAKQSQGANAAAWLAEQCQYCFWGFHGRSSRQYRTDIDTEPLLQFLLARELNDESRHLSVDFLTKSTVPPFAVYLENGMTCVAHLVT